MSHQAARGALFGRLRQFVDMRASLRRLAAGGKALVHDAANGARAPPALRAAAKAAVDLIGGGRPAGRRIDGRPHVAVAENVAGTNDHRVTW